MPSSARLLVPGQRLPELHQDLTNFLWAAASRASMAAWALADMQLYTKSFSRTYVPLGIVALMYAASISPCPVKKPSNFRCRLRYELPATKLGEVHRGQTLPPRQQYLFRLLAVDNGASLRDLRSRRLFGMFDRLDFDDFGHIETRTRVCTRLCCVELRHAEYSIYAHILSFFLFR